MQTRIYENDRNVSFRTLVVLARTSLEEMRSLTGVCDRESQDFTVVESSPGTDSARNLLQFEANADSQP